MPSSPTDPHSENARSAGDLATDIDLTEQAVNLGDPDEKVVGSIAAGGSTSGS